MCREIGALSNDGARTPPRPELVVQYQSDMRFLRFDARQAKPLFHWRGRRLGSIAEADPRDSSDDGIVAVGGELSVAELAAAYRRGIFPWPHNGYPLCWFCLDPRAVLDFSDLHIPKSLARERRRTELTFTVDRAFPEVIAACKTTKRPDQGGTWITPAMQKAYIALHEAGIAHSVEAWTAAGELAGGLYGVDCGGVFTGESMFYREPQASKLSVLFLVDRLREHGSTWLDIQTMTPHFEAMGAVEIPRAVFLARLAGAQSRGVSLLSAVDVPATSLPTF